MSGPLRKSIRWILLTSFILLLIPSLILIGAFSWLKYDNDNLRYALEVGLSQWLQRELQVGEIVESDLGLDTYLVAKNVSLANPAWATDSAFVSAGHLELEINLPSIWESGPVVINRLVLDSVSLNLLAPEGAQATWEFWPDREQNEPTTEQAPFPIFIGDGKLNQTVITYRDPDQDLVIHLLETRIEQKTGEKLLTLQTEGEINERRLSINGQAGPPRALFTGRNLAVDLAMQIGQLSLQGRGTVSDASKIDGLELELKARSPISRPLLDMLGMPEVRDGPLHFDANLTSAGSALQVEVQGSLGEFDLDLRGSVDQPQEIDGISAAFSLDGPSLKEAGAMFEVHTLPDVPYLLAGKLLRRGDLFEFSEVKAEAGSSQVLLSGRLPAFPRIDDWKISMQGRGINLALLGPALGLVDIPDSSYQMAGDLRPTDQGIELIDLKIENENSHLILNGVVGDGPEYYQTHLNFELAGQRIADMSPWLGLQRMPEQPFSIGGTASYQQSGWTLQDGKFSSQDLQLGLDVNVDRLINTGAIEGRIRAASPRPMETLRAYGLDTDFELPLPLTFSGVVKGTPESLSLERGELTLGEHSGSLSGDLGNLRDMQHLRLKLGLSGPDLLQLYPLESMPLPGSVKYQATGKLAFSEESMRIDSLDLELPDHQLELAGQVHINTQQPLTVRAEIAAQARSSHRLESLWTDQPQFLDSNLELTANLLASSSGIEIDPINIDAGHSDIGGKLALILDNRPFLKATLTSEKLYLPLLVPELEQLEQPAKAPAEDEDFNIEEFTDALTKQELQERLIPDKPLNLDAMGRIDANIDYRINQLYLKEDAVSTVFADFDLAQGVLTSDRFQWDGSFSKGQAVVYLDASKMPLVSRVEAAGERIPFLWLLAGEPDDTGESVYRGRVESRGSTAREIAANLDGALIFRDEGGRLDNYDLDLLMGDLLGEIIDRLNPTTAARTHSEVECSAGAVIVTDGLVEVVPGLILRHDKLDFVSAGSINLNTEAIDLAFSTRSRKGIGFSAGRTLTNYIKLGGTLANPRITLDPRGAAISGSAAIATAGWSILAESMWDRWVLTAGDPCKRLIKKARDDKKRDYESLWRPKGNPS